VTTQGHDTCFPASMTPPQLTDGEMPLPLRRGPIEKQGPKASWVNDTRARLTILTHSAWNGVRREFQPGHLLPSVFAGAVIALMAVTMAVSIAALIFVRPIEGWMTYGSDLMLLTVIIAGLGMALFSSFAGTIAIPEDRVAPILALMAGLIIHSMGAGAAPETIAMTVLASIMVSSLLVGLTCFLLGSFQWGNVVRFIPHPVIGGFLAGSGWLLVVGSCRVMNEKYSSLSSMGDFFNPIVFEDWLPGAAFGVVLYLTARWAKHFLTMPSLLLVALVGFFVWLNLSDISIADAREHSWLLEVQPNAHFHPLRMLPKLVHADWGTVIGQAGSFGAILLIVVISILLNTTSLELAVDRDIDLNQELRAAGLTNMVGGLFGGMAGCQSLSLSRLASGLGKGKSTRIVGLVVVIISSLLLWFAPHLLGCIPRFILGGILMFHGIEFLVEWVYDAYFELALEDYLLVQLILIVVTVAGYLEGVGAGIIVAAVLFVIKYSSIDIVKNALSGVTCQSTVDRWTPQKKLLRVHGEQIYILRLSGFIFFGSANSLLHRVRQRSADGTLPRLRFVLLDFQHVSGMDASALISMVKLERLAAKEDFVLVASAISKEIERHFRYAELAFNTARHMRLFSDYDHALEWCEDTILQEEFSSQPEKPKTLLQIIEETHSPRFEAGNLLHYLERVDVKKGQKLTSQGEDVHELYFIESGRVQVMVELGGDRHLRIRTLEAGTVVGEMGLFLNQRRTASVVAEGDGTAYRLTAGQMKRMEEEEPALAVAFYQFIIRTLAERMTNQNLALKALQD
jgi:sulfate permease, SulP family